MLVHVKFIKPEDLDPKNFAAGLEVFENARVALSDLGHVFDPMQEIRRLYRENIYPEIIQEGIFDAWKLEDYFEYCTSHTIKEKNVVFDGIPAFGVCDSAADIHRKFSKYICNKSGNYIIQMCAITRDSKASVGDLWKWADHGEYIGKQTPTTEMIKDEPNIEKVYMFKILEVEEKN